MTKRVVVLVSPNDGLLITSLYKGDQCFRNESRKALKVEVIINVIKTIDPMLPEDEFWREVGELTQIENGKAPVIKDGEVFG